MNLLEEILNLYINKKVNERLCEAYKTIAEALHNRLDFINVNLWEKSQLERLIEELKRIGDSK